jgi:hypothetical protein
MAFSFSEGNKWHPWMPRSSLTGLLISVKLPRILKTVIPEATVIGNPASNRLNVWIPDKEIRG